jgi:GSH-dependent disulfide-bond oxidoreductase
MALELYHWEPNGACGRVMIALKEKGLDFKSHYVDVLAFEQLKPEYLKISEDGQVPVLVHDGQALRESSYIVEYIDEAFPQTPLMPKDTMERWAVRVWQKYIDDYLAAAVSDTAWTALELQSFKNRDKAATDASIAKVPTKERRDVWLKAMNGFADDVEKSNERIKECVGKIEKDLENRSWLAAPTYTLADLSVFSYANYLPKTSASLVNEKDSPRMIAWLKRMRERPAVKAALAMSKSQDPYAVAAPGSEHVRWG